MAVRGIRIAETRVRLPVSPKLTLDNFAQFNLLEGIFWLVLSVTSFVLYRFLPDKFQKLSLTAGVILFLFGLSDLVEISTGGFLPGPWWLLIWKMASAIGIIGIILWYLKLRIKS